MYGEFRENVSYEDWRDGKRWDDEYERRRFTQTNAGAPEIIEIDLRLWPELREQMLAKEREWME